MSKSTGGVCNQVDSTLNSSTHEDGQDLFTRNADAYTSANDKKRPATRVVGDSANDNVKRQRIIEEEKKKEPMIPSLTKTSASASGNIASVHNAASGNDIETTPTKNSYGVVSDAKKHIVNMEFSNDNANCSSALSSACSSPVHHSSVSDQSVGKESGNESASAASVSSAASSASSASSYQCPPPPPTTPITGYKPYAQVQEREITAFHNVATPKPSSSSVSQLSTDQSRNVDTQSTSSITEEESKSPAYESSAARNESSSRRRSVQVSDDFDSWKVGPQYELMRILGRGSYGEVAQAKDLHQIIPVGGNPKYVAIKRITTAFQQEVDALRFFREVHLLKRLRGHDCIIQLIDVVAPESNQELDDIYLIFECKFLLSLEMNYTFLLAHTI